MRLLPVPDLASVWAASVPAPILRVCTLRVQPSPASFLCLVCLRLTSTRGLTQPAGVREQLAAAAGAEDMLRSAFLATDQASILGLCTHKWVVGGTEDMLCSALLATDQASIMVWILRHVSWTNCD